MYYRGQDALVLAVEATLEEVAVLLWSGELNGRHFDYSTPQGMPEWGEKDRFSALDSFQLALLQAAALDPAAYDLRPESVINSGVRIMTLLTRVLSPISPSINGIAGALQEGWGLAVEARPLLNAALVLCADHELNVSTFTARCIASAGSTPYAVVQGGLAALQGARHGGHTARVEALLREVGQAEDAQAVLTARLRRGESLPGFGHPLYPDGDPRARLLLELVESHCPPSRAQELALGIAAAAAELLGVQPTIDFALVTMALTLALPTGSALALFALGRTVGWLAHALEQYAAGTLIRPRARYSGERPEIHR